MNVVKKNTWITFLNRQFITLEELLCVSNYFSHIFLTQYDVTPRCFDTKKFTPFTNIHRHATVFQYSYQKQQSIKSFPLQRHITWLIVSIIGKTPCFHYRNNAVFGNFVRKLGKNETASQLSSSYFACKIFVDDLLPTLLDPPSRRPSTLTTLW